MFIFAECLLHLWLQKQNDAARAAVKKIKVDIEPLPVITDPRKQKKKDELIVPPRTFKLGDTDDAWQECDYIFEGRAETNGQEHLYIETQGAYAIPQENGAIKIYSSTQGPTAVQRALCKVTGIAMHQVEVDVTRLGGGFGGKEDQANTWAAIVCTGNLSFKKAGEIFFASHGRYAHDRQATSLFI